MDAFSVDLTTVQTNMVYAQCARPADEVALELQHNGVDVFDISPTHIRIVVHLHITDEDVERFIDLCKRIF
jgi:threonine aldolase